MTTVATINAGVAYAAEAFTDDFTGPAGSSPNTSIWNFETGGGGWGNNEKQTYTNTRENSRLDGDGHLLIEARESGGNWTSARINTFDKRTFTYGTISARMAMPKGQGLHTGFWLLGTDIYSAGFPQAGEVDIAEHINNNNFVHIGIHGPTASGGLNTGSLDLGSLGGLFPLVSGKYERGSDKTGIDPTEFHTYGVTKSATSISFLFDGDAFFTIAKSSLTSDQQWVFDKPMYAILNLAVGGVWPGSTNSSTPNPATLTVDWVKYTP